MTVRRLTYHGDPVLHTPCQPITKIDASVRELIDDLVDTLYATTGVGLAAPQIGVSRKVFAFDPSRTAGRRDYTVLINPVITAREGSIVSERESCLSAPALHLDVPRAATVHVEGLDARGRAVSFEASGFAAIVIQHELDHLDGRVVSDRLPPEHRDEYERVLARVVRQHTSRWYIDNLRAIQRRLDPVMRRPEGVLHARRQAGSEIIVDKTGSLVQLSVRTKSDARATRAVGVLDLVAPLDLFELDRQAMMLSLLWTPEPSRLCVVGLGGGRLPMVFRQHFAAAAIDAVEPDAEMSDLAQRFFGVQTDDRLRIVAADGRSFLEQTEDGAYDAILLDPDRAATRDPYALSTREFYRVCQSRLNAGGVVISTVSADGPLAREKVATFAASFVRVLQCTVDGWHVMFGSDAAPDDEAVDRAEERYVPRTFRLRELAKTLAPLTPGVRDAADGMLLDADRQTPAQPSLPTDVVFSGVERNDPCPCGSGRKFKKCHGR
jgi:peptide deformylase